jgi:hypothetical protein
MRALVHHLVSAGVPHTNTETDRPNQHYRDTRIGLSNGGGSGRSVCRGCRVGAEPGQPLGEWPPDLTGPSQRSLLSVTASCRGALVDGVARLVLVAARPPRERPLALPRQTPRISACEHDGRRPRHPDCGGHVSREETSGFAVGLCPGAGVWSLLGRCGMDEMLGDGWLVAT